MENKKLIDLNYAIRQLELGELEHGGNFETDSYHVKEFLSVLPTVDAVEVVYGQWIRKQIIELPGADEVCCSVCDNFIGVVFSDAGFEEAVKDMHYCPSCGAQMDGDKND